MAMIRQKTDGKSLFFDFKFILKYVTNVQFMITDN